MIHRNRRSAGPITPDRAARMGARVSRCVCARVSARHHALHRRPAGRPRTPAEEDSDLVCQPGVGWMDINAELKRRGIPLFFPVRPPFSPLSPLYPAPVLRPSRLAGDCGFAFSCLLPCRQSRARKRVLSFLTHFSTEPTRTY